MLESLRRLNARVECYGTIDELISQMGFARAITDHKEVYDLVKEIQRELFKVGSAIGTAPGARKPAPAEVWPARFSATTCSRIFR